MLQLEIVQGSKARQFYEWFEQMRLRAARMGLHLVALTADELRRFA